MSDDFESATSRRLRLGGSRRTFADYEALVDEDEPAQMIPGDVCAARGPTGKCARPLRHPGRHEFERPAALPKPSQRSTKDAAE